MPSCSPWCRFERWLVLHAQTSNMRPFTKHPLWQRCGPERCKQSVLSDFEPFPPPQHLCLASEQVLEGRASLARPCHVSTVQALVTSLEGLAFSTVLCASPLWLQLPLLQERCQRFLPAASVLVQARRALEQVQRCVPLDLFKNTQMAGVAEQVWHTMDSIVRNWQKALPDALQKPYDVHMAFTRPQTVGQQSLIC